MRWVVYEGLQGSYLPNYTLVVANRKEAEALLVDIRRQLLDAGYVVRGSARQLYIEYKHPFQREFCYLAAAEPILEEEYTESEE